MSGEVEVFHGELSDIGAWARDANEIAQMAAKLVQTSFVPASFNGKPAEATAAILTGMEVGLKPMASLRSIVVINGTPALTAQALRGLAQSAGHKIWVEESTSHRAVVKGVRRGDDQVQTSTWDVARAQSAKLMDKAMYKSQAQSMFVARATAEIVRLIASDVVMGLAYSIEELADDVPPATDEPVKKASTRTARKPLQVAEPSLPGEPVVEAEPAAAVEPAAEPVLDEDEAFRQASIRDAEEAARERTTADVEEPALEWEQEQ